MCLLFFERHFVASSKQVVGLTLCIPQKIHGLVMIATIKLKKLCGAVRFQVVLLVA